MIDGIRARYMDYYWEPVTQRRMRSVYRLVRQGHHTLYIKVYHPRSALQMLRNLLAPKTLKEARMLYVLARHGMKVPLVTNHLKIHTVSALVTRGIEGSMPLWRLDETSRVKVMLDMALSLLQRGFYHRDFHVGNIMIDEKGNSYLLDVYGVYKARKVKERHVVGMLSQILMAHSPADDVLTEDYLNGLPFVKHVQTVVEKARLRAEAKRKSWVRGNVRRSLRSGSFSDKVRTGEYFAFVRKGISLDLDKIMACHRDNMSRGVDILKLQEKTQLSRVNGYCVKTYASPGPIARPYALRAWKGLLTLYFNAVPVPEPVAVVVFRDRSSMLITGFLDLATLDKILYHDYSDMENTDKVRMLKYLGRLVGQMHYLGIYHADLKACNFLVDADQRIFIVDTDRVTQSRAVTRRRRIKNLVQLNTSIPLGVPRSARMRFIWAYAEVMHEQPRELFNKVWKLSRHRDIVYTTSQGDKVEAWD